MPEIVEQAGNAAMNLPEWIVAVGYGQLLIVIGSLAIPYVLQWRKQVAGLRPLTRQVFWTYAGYIWSTNLFFAIISILLPHELLGKSALAMAVCLFIALYWAARVVIQFTYFDRSDAPQGWFYQVAEAMLVLLFVTFTCVYGYAVWHNGNAIT